MSDVPDRVRDLVEHVVRASEPAAALRALNALRDELLTIERLQVARALDAGESYGAIARALGISRQAAHRRYRDLERVELPDPRAAKRGGAPRRILVTSEVRTAVNLAREEASLMGAATVGSEHLLLGILRSGSPHAANALRAGGVTLEAARRCARPTLVEGAPEAPPPPRAPTLAPGPRGVSAYARTVFEQSLRVAVRRGDGYIGVDHLLVSSLEDSAGGAWRTLDALGIDPEAVRSRLAATVA